MDELKPCPFCGGEAELKDLINNLYGFNGYEIKCGCGCVLKSHLCSEPRWEGNKYCTPVTERGKAKALNDLIVLWNRRKDNEQSEEELTKAHINAHYEAICALADMVGQFGYSTTFRKQKAVCDGGLSALEYAFGALLDCGCKMNSNGTITLKNLWAFQEEFEAKMKGVN